MHESFLQAKNLIERSNKILLTMHERMDGDDGGSLLAMHSHLKKLGKQTTCAIKKGVPPSLKFLPESRAIKDDIDSADFDLLITFGCATIDRTGSENIANLQVPTINFDHHQDNSFFGTVNVVDKSKSSVAELVYDFFKWCGWPVTKEVATCLLTGIITDTGSFMHSNTAVSTLNTAAELMRKGTLTEKIIQHTFKGKKPRILRAWGKAIENAHFDEDRQFIFSVFTEKDAEEFPDLPPGAFEGFIDMLNTVPEAKFAMFIRQEGDIIKGSLRSDEFKNVDVAKIAKLFGGGGHRLAAGFSAQGKILKNPEGKWTVTNPEIQNFLLS